MKKDTISINHKCVKSVLSRTGIQGARYCINPYTGCLHGCLYCYASFMQRYTGHSEPWGSFVDIKSNAPEVLEREIKNAKRGSIIISSVTDPYQPVEKRYGITKRCLEILLRYDHPVDILTKSDLILRDIDILRNFNELYAGITITTDDDRVRRIFEPGAPEIQSRVRALKELFRKGIKTYIFIGPLLPMDPRKLASMINGYSDHFYIDRMNYTSKTIHIYRKYGLTRYLEDRYFLETEMALKEYLKESGGVSLIRN